MSDSRVSNSNAQAARAGRRTEYVVDTTSWDESRRAFSSNSQLWGERELNFTAASSIVTISWIGSFASSVPVTYKYFLGPNFFII